MLAPVALVPAMVLVSVALARPTAASASRPAAERIWLADCAVCHGDDGTGTDVAPSLEGVGRASVDYQVSTGRMPLARVGRDEAPGRQLRPLPDRHRSDPDQPTARHAPAYDAATVRRLVAYVGRLVADGGPGIPTVGRGDVAAGGLLYRENCAACHSWSGEGGALLHREAPMLHDATPVQIAEVVRVGSGQMPAFGPAALTDGQLDDVVRYVRELDHPDDRGGLALRHLGPVAEGAVALVALAALLWGCLWIGDRS